MKKEISKKTVPDILKFVTMLFLIFEKGDKKKTVPGILRFVSMLFNLIIFLVWMGVIETFRVCKYPFLIFNIKEFIGMFRICMYAFLTWLFFSMNEFIEILGVWVKILEFADMLFCLFKSYRMCQNRLLYTSLVKYPWIKTLNWEFMENCQKLH